MIIAGIGLRATATTAELQAALAGSGAARLATPADKAQHPAFAGLALPLVAVPLIALADQPAQTESPRQPARYGRHSVAECAALAAAGPGATLIQPRRIAAQGRVTLALALAKESP